MPDFAQILRVAPDDPDNGSIKKAGKVLEQNGIVIFPAACMYGVAASAVSNEAVEKVFRLKQRPKEKAILVLIPGPGSLPELAASIPPAAEKLMSAFWPGKLTLIFKARKRLSPILTAGTGKIGIRQPAHPVARALVNQAGFPLTGTSANLSGGSNAVTIDQLPLPIMEDADLILDAGRLKGGMGSTIVDITTDPVSILREGQVSKEQVQAALDS